MSTKLPSDLVAVGYVTGAYGVQGWVRIHPYSAQADALMHAKTWWIGRSLRDVDADPASFEDVERLDVKLHGDEVVAKLMGVIGRDSAQALKGSIVQIQRSHFPALSKNEFYWLDLIGANVENLAGHYFGKVEDLIDSGAHPILRVVLPLPVENSQTKEPPREYLIPFVERFVPTVDLENKKIIVDWELDY